MLLRASGGGGGVFVDLFFKLGGVVGGRVGVGVGLEANLGNMGGRKEAFVRWNLQ